MGNKVLVSTTNSCTLNTSRLKILRSSLLSMMPSTINGLQKPFHLVSFSICSEKQEYKF